MVWAPFVVRVGGGVTNCRVDHRSRNHRAPAPAAV